MAKTKYADHAGFRNGQLFCYNCGKAFDMQYPQPVTFAATIMKAFSKAHKDCPKTWEQPQVNQSLPEIGKALWWATGMNAPRGTSSNAMFFHLVMNMAIGIDGKKVKEFFDDHEDWKPAIEETPGKKLYTKAMEIYLNDSSIRSHPSDADDFSRCYFLVKTIPEWKEKLPVMANVSPAWKTIVENWDLLCAMYDAKRWENMHEILKNLDNGTLAPNSKQDVAMGDDTSST